MNQLKQVQVNSINFGNFISNEKENLQQQNANDVQKVGFQKFIFQIQQILMQIDFRTQLNKLIQDDSIRQRQIIRGIYFLKYLRNISSNEIDYLKQNKQTLDYQVVFGMNNPQMILLTMESLIKINLCNNQTIQINLSNFKIQNPYKLSVLGQNVVVFHDAGFSVIDEKNSKEILFELKDKNEIAQAKFSPDETQLAFMYKFEKKLQIYNLITQNMYTISHDVNLTDTINWSKSGEFISLFSIGHNVVKIFESFLWTHQTLQFQKDIKNFNWDMQDNSFVCVDSDNCVHIFQNRNQNLIGKQEFRLNFLQENQAKYFCNSFNIQTLTHTKGEKIVFQLCQNGNNVELNLCKMNGKFSNISKFENRSNNQCQIQMYIYNEMNQDINIVLVNQNQMHLHLITIQKQLIF